MDCIIYNGKTYTQKDFITLLAGGEIEKLASEKRVDVPITQFAKDLDAKIKKVNSRYERLVKIQFNKYQAALNGSEELKKLRKYFSEDSKRILESDATIIKNAGLTGAESVSSLKQTLAKINNAWTATKAQIEAQRKQDTDIILGKPVLASDKNSLQRIVGKLFNLRGSINGVRQDEAAATLMDKVFETMAKRAGVSVSELYKRTYFKSSTMDELLNPLLNLVDGALDFQLAGPIGQKNLGISPAQTMMINGVPIYEISDVNMSLRDVGPEYMTNLINNIKSGTTLSQLIYHPELFKAYPQLAGLKVKALNTSDNTFRGAFQPSGPIFNKNTTIKLNPLSLEGTTPTGPLELLKTLVHEVQHAVQFIEGWEYGADPSIFRDKIRMGKDAAKAAIELMTWAKDNNKVLSDTLVEDDYTDLEDLLTSIDYDAIPTAADIAEVRRHLNTLQNMTKGDIKEMYMNLQSEVEARNTELRYEYATMFADEEGAPMESTLQSVLYKPTVNAPTIFTSSYNALLSVISNRQAQLTTGSTQQVTEAEVKKSIEDAAKDNVEGVAKAASVIYADAGYHRGTLPEKSDYATNSFGGDMPFTGYYFVSDPKDVVQGGSRFGDPKAFRIVDFSKYNLLKLNTNQYWVVKNALKKISRDIVNEGISKEESIERNSRGYGYSQMLEYWMPEFLNKLRSTDFSKEVEDYKKEINKDEFVTERLETLILKKMGYEGVDVRGTKESEGEASPDSFSEGSVIFDLKENTVSSLEGAYVKAKKDGSNPDLVKALEDVIGIPKPKQNLDFLEIARALEGVKTPTLLDKAAKLLGATKFSNSRRGRAEGDIEIERQQEINDIVNVNPTPRITIKGNEIIFKDGNSLYDKLISEGFTAKEAFGIIDSIQDFIPNESKDFYPNKFKDENVEDISSMIREESFKRYINAELNKDSYRRKIAEARERINQLKDGEFVFTNKSIAFIKKALNEFENGDVFIFTDKQLADLGISKTNTKSILYSADIAKAYIQAKEDGSNPKLVKAVEDVIGSPRYKSEQELTGEKKVKVFRGTGRNVKQGENDAFQWVAEDRKVAENYSKDGKVEEIEVTIPSNPFEMPTNTIYVKGEDIGNRLRVILNKQFSDKVITREQATDISEKISDFEKKAGSSLELYSTKVNKKESAQAFVAALKGLGFDGLIQKESYSSESPFTNTITGNETNTYGIFKEQLEPKSNQRLTDEEISNKLEETFNPNYKNTIVEKLAKFDEQIANKNFPSVLTVAQAILPRSIFNKYKSFYELAARNNITVSNEKLPPGLSAAWAFNNVQLNKETAKYYLEDYNEFAETLNHEIIHGLLSRGIKDNYALYSDLQDVWKEVLNRYDSAPQEIKDIISYINDTQKEFKERNIQNATSEELSSGNFREVGSLEELITYAFTNKKFAYFLDSIPATKNIGTTNGSLFQQLKNIIREYIKSISGKSTAFDEINYTLDKYFDTSWNEQNIAERNAQYNWGLQFKASENIFDKYNNDPKTIMAQYRSGNDAELVQAVNGLFGVQQTELTPQQRQQAITNWKSKIYQEALDLQDINSLRTSLRRKAPDSETLGYLDEIANGIKNNEGSEDPMIDSFISGGITLSNIKNMLIEDDIFDTPKDVDSYFISIGGQNSRGIFNRLAGLKSASNEELRFQGGITQAQAAYQSSGSYSVGKGGVFQTLQDGQDILHAISNPNVSSPLHELAHKFEKFLTEEERRVILDWATVTPEWTTQTSEAFARGFEKYLAEGNAPTPALQKIFDAFKIWLTAIYEGIVGSDIDVELNDAMRAIYARMLGENFEEEVKQKSASVSTDFLAGLSDEQVEEIFYELNPDNVIPELSQLENIANSYGIDDNIQSLVDNFLKPVESEVPVKTEDELRAELNNKLSEVELEFLDDTVFVDKPNPRALKAKQDKLKDKLEQLNEFIKCL